MEIKDSHVRALYEYTDAEFAIWLLGGFGNLRRPNYLYRAFAPATHLLLSQPSVLLSLRQIFEALPDDAKQRLRSGVAIAIDRIRPGATAADILNDLLLFAAAIGSCQAIKPIQNLLGTAFFQSISTAQGRPIFALALNVVCSLAPAKHAFSALTAFCSSTFFRDPHAPIALVGLCRSDPGHIALSLAKLRKRFHNLNSERGTTGVERIGQELASSIPLNHLAYAITNLKIANPTRESYTANDNWFLEALLGSNTPPLLLDTPYPDDDVDDDGAAGFVLRGLFYARSPPKVSSNGMHAISIKYDRDGVDELLALLGEYYRRQEPLRQTVQAVRHQAELRRQRKASGNGPPLDKSYTPVMNNLDRQRKSRRRSRLSARR